MSSTWPGGRRSRVEARGVDVTHFPSSTAPWRKEKRLVRSTQLAPCGVGDPARRHTPLRGGADRDQRTVGLPLIRSGALNATTPTISTLTSALGSRHARPNWERSQL